MIPELNPAQDAVLRWQASGNPGTPRSDLALSSVLAALAIWLCAGGFAGWLESGAAPAALACWSAVLLLDLRLLQVRSRRLWLSGTSLVYQSILLGFVGDVSTLTALRGRRALSGALHELVLERRNGPLLRLRVSDWREQDMRALIDALLRLRPWIKMDPLVERYAGIRRRNERAAAAVSNTVAVWR